jgi:hypothetical protein
LLFAKGGRQLAVDLKFAGRVASGLGINAPDLKAASGQVVFEQEYFKDFLKTQP